MTQNLDNIPYCIVIEDGNIINNSNIDKLWDGQFSTLPSTGFLIKYIQNCLPKNAIVVIPRSDGNTIKNNNIFFNIDWDTQIQPYIDYAKQQNKVFILGTLAQLDGEEEGVNYLYLPLDDNFFEYGINHYYDTTNLPLWENRSSDLCWRGSCSGMGGLESARVRFVDKVYNYDINTNVRLSTWWSEGKNIPYNYFADRFEYYTEFFKYKIFFIVDGNTISSNYMYGFASGCVPFLITRCVSWFSHLIVPYIHYIPVNYDLSNLIEQIEWVKNNDDKAKIIAENALKFAQIYFSSEYQKKYIKESIEKMCKTLEA